MDDELLVSAPESFEGLWFRWVWKPGDPSEGIYNVQSVFLSAELQERFGKVAIHYNHEPLRANIEFVNSAGENRNVVDIDLEDLRGSGFQALNESTLEDLEEEGVHAENWQKTLLTSELNDFIFGEGQSKLIYYSYPGKAAPAPVPRYGAFEDQFRASFSDLGRSRGVGYSGPLFVYAIDNNLNGTEPFKLVEPTSPINIAFQRSIGLPPQNNLTPTNVSYQMQSSDSDPWTARGLPQGIRHVIVQNGNKFHLQPQTDYAAKRIRLSKQWHIRLFRIPRGMDRLYRIAGQVHKDPWDHNQLESITRNKLSTSWDYRDAREQVTSHWSNNGYKTNKVNIGNNRLPEGTVLSSCDGLISLISDNNLLFI
jgi:hypothetical protein